MRSDIYRETRVALYILTALLAFSMIFYFFASMFTSMGYKGFKHAENANAELKEELTIILDPGHGGEDPGATSNGLCEKDLNLEIALSLFEILSENGYNVVLTRNEDVLLYNPGEESRKKYHDVRNREAIAESYENAVFVSLHMNKFPLDYCKGLQTFYSDNNSNSKVLADIIQKDITLLQQDNRRSTKIGNSTIYLMKNLNMPAVLVECGFLSNSEEALLLKNEDYKKSLTLSLFCSISDYMENYI